MEIRELRKEEHGLLKDFLYEAIYVPDNEQKPSRDIILQPELQVYINGFGRKSLFLFRKQIMQSECIKKQGFGR